MTNKNTQLDNLKNKPIKKWGGVRPNSGRPKGSMNKSTKEKKLIEDAFKDRILSNIQDLLTSQLNIAKGSSYLFRVEEEKDNKGRIKKKKHILVTDPYEIQQVLDECEGTGMFDDNYYYITTEKPNTSALDSLIDRVFGKSQSNNTLDVNVEAQSTSISIDYSNPGVQDLLDTNARKLLEISKNKKYETTIGHNTVRGDSESGLEDGDREVLQLPGPAVSNSTDDGHTPKAGVSESSAGGDDSNPVSKDDDVRKSEETGHNLHTTDVERHQEPSGGQVQPNDQRESGAAKTNAG